MLITSFKNVRILEEGKRKRNYSLVDIMQVSFTESEVFRLNTRREGAGGGGVARKMTRVAVSEYGGGVIVTGRYKTTKWGVTAVTARVEVRRTRERMARDLVIAQQ